MVLNMCEDRGRPKQEAKPDVPIDPLELLVSHPLYAPVVVSDEHLEALKVSGVQFDCYCVMCGKEATFKSLQYIAKMKEPPKSISSKTSPSVPLYKLPGYFSVTAICQRENAHKYQFYLMHNGEKVNKVGQWPSVEDIASGDIGELRSVLGAERYRELKRATGLASYGIGIGSFVYLRRIFEALIWEHYEQYEERHGKIDGFKGMPMSKKVSELAGVLPPAIIENKAAYEILSSGVHELDEETCKKYFSVIRRAIIIILRDDLRHKQERQDVAAMKHEMGNITGEIRATQGRRGNKRKPTSD